MRRQLDALASFQLFTRQFAVPWGLGIHDREGLSRLDLWCFLPRWGLAMERCAIRWHCRLATQRCRS